MGISALCETRLLSPSLTRLNKPPVKTCGITRHQEADFKHVVKEDRKAQQVFSCEMGEGVKA